MQINCLYSNQENPKTISVFELSMRTTSSLEGFNSQLNKKFAKQGNFFKFLRRLIEVEYVESRKMSQMVDSGGSAKSYREKQNDITIRNATTDLKNGTTTVIEFLNNVTCKENNTVTNMANYDVPQGYVSDSDSCSDSECLPENDETPSAIQSQPIDENLCVICADRRSNVLFLPCRHLRTCEECSSLLRAQSENALTCPMCKQLVENTIVVFI